MEWARLDRKATPKAIHLMGRLFDDYESKIIPGLKSGTQKDYMKGAEAATQRIRRRAHSTEEMTKKVYRRVGEVVSPTK